MGRRCGILIFQALFNFKFVAFLHESRLDKSSLRDFSSLDTLLRTASHTPIKSCFFNLPQNRHPERSASQIYRVIQRLGAESKDLEGAYLSHAVGNPFNHRSKHLARRARHGYSA